MIIVTILSPVPTELIQLHHTLPRLKENRPGNLCKFKLLFPLPESWQYQSNSECCHMTTVKPNCVMH